MHSVLMTYRTMHRATVMVAGLFVVQTAVYAFHESAEARLLPWSELLHAATEPYGPDGAYGRYYSALLLVMPLMAVAFTTLKTRFSFVTPETRRWIAALAPQCIACLALAAGTGAVVTELNGKRGVSYASESASPSGRTGESTAGAPHLWCRHAAVDANHSRRSITPLDARQLAERASASFISDRVSYAAGRGICLASDRRLFTTYKAGFFDRALKP